MKRYILPIDDIQRLEALERLNYEVNSYSLVMERMLTSHVGEPKFLQSPIFMEYQKEFQTKLMEYEKAKNDFTHYMMPIVKDYENNPNAIFSWNIEDFSTKTVEITIQGE